MNATLVGVGVGPGDPELVTVKAVRVLRAADVVFVPVADSGETGRAEATVLHHVDAARTRRVVFALRDPDWPGVAREVAGWFGAHPGGTAAFATIGDPTVYSTFSRLAGAVRELLPGLIVEQVPGVTAMQDLAARTGIPLVEGRETLALLPMTAGTEAFTNALETFETVVAYKFGAMLPQTIAALRDAGRLDQAVYGAALGLPGEDIRPAGELSAAPGPYLSTLIVPPRRGRRAGNR
jgi:precorrin-2/cobalt-factor-2 C20-methyltransferase